MEKKAKFSFGTGSEAVKSGAVLTMPLDIAESILSWLEIPHLGQSVELDTDLLIRECFQGEAEIERKLLDVKSQGVHLKEKSLDPHMELLSLGMVRTWTYNLRQLAREARDLKFTKIIYEEI